ncbi:MAG: glycerol-3-phosphate 1-O-acyltransferase PlsY [Candidatus Hydrogenedentes bacterium]|nr:glycerol-3-phosphate 1-O-acyltransferase PlsY [Candidatus Hydrogenedentota bacterium]
MITVFDILALLIAYVLGSIPTGLWVGLRVRGIDIRQHGSQNIGATNTLRVLGKKIGAIALAGDVLKGVVAVVAVSKLGSWPYLPLACGLAAILGHTFSIFLRFKGGKGVATSTGVFLGLATVPTLIAAIAWGLVFWRSRMVSAASLAAAVVLTAAVWVLPHAFAIRLTVTLVALLVFVRHRSNIGRILRGEESRF